MNNIFKNKKNNESGQAALLIVLIVMLLLLFVGLFLSNTVLRQIKATKNAEQFTQAYFLADAGTERVLHNLKSGNIDLNGFSVDDNLFGGPVNIIGVGYYNVTLESSSPLIIKIEGVHKNTARAIEISW